MVVATFGPDRDSPVIRRGDGRRRAVDSPALSMTEHVSWLCSPGLALTPLHMGPEAGSRIGQSAATAEAAGERSREVRTSRCRCCRRGRRRSASGAASEACRDCQEAMDLATVRVDGKAHDLARGIDAESVEQVQGRLAGNEAVEVVHHPILPKECRQVLPAGVDRDAGDLALVVDRDGSTYDVPRQRTQVGHHARSAIGTRAGRCRLKCRMRRQSGRGR